MTWGFKELNFRKLNSFKSDQTDGPSAVTDLPRISECSRVILEPDEFLKILNGSDHTVCFTVSAEFSNNPIVKSRSSGLFQPVPVPPASITVYQL